MQRIVSIDIGVLNFAYAAADVHNGKVRVTKVRCIKICNSGLNIGESVNYLLAALGDKFNPDSWSTTIVIEQQLSRNLKAKCLSMTVQRFFRTFALARSLPLPHTVFMNAKDKFGFLQEAPRSQAWLCQQGQVQGAQIQIHLRSNKPTASRRLTGQGRRYSRLLHLIKQERRHSRYPLAANELPLDNQTESSHHQLKTRWVLKHYS